MAQDRSILNTFLVLCSVRQEMGICTEMLSMAKRGSQCGEKGKVLLSCAFCHSVVTASMFC